MTNAFIDRKINGNFLVAGVARNCAPTIMGDLIRLRTAIGKVKSLHWLFIESDSSDSTASVMREMEDSIDAFRHISLGNLRNEIPLRTARISHCRNVYIKEIRENPLYHEINYVIVADVDGINSMINETAINSCWSRDDWDMCASNQSGPYYDIWALRHPTWNPGDCWAEHDFIKQYQPIAHLNMACIYSKMIRIPESHDWVEVDSAFGGLAIYNRKLFELGEYLGISNTGAQCCEHVHFHNTIKKHGARLFINPMLINAEYTEHTIHFKPSAALKPADKQSPQVYQYKNFQITLPSDHLLPIYSRNHPKYDKFLPHLSKYIQSSKTIIDIGANVGDTVSGMVTENPLPTYVCIEADDVFFKYLVNNIKRIRESTRVNVYAIKALIGKDISDVSLTGTGGSKHAVTDEEGELQPYSLDEVITHIPEDLDIRLIKSDTDGYDYDVLNSSMRMIEAYQPLLFFECQFENMNQRHGFESTMNTLERLGYRDWTVFDNFGEVILRTPDLGTIRQLMSYIWSQNTGRTTRTIYYYDILAAHKNDINNINKVITDYLST